MRSPQLLSTGTATINMTPMIDVVFLLIIFFLVSSHLAKNENQLPLELPIAQSGLNIESDRRTMVINVLADGTWQVSGRGLQEAELASAMRDVLQQSLEPLRLTIRTDESVPYERIEPVLAAASKVGIGDIVFSVYERRPR